MSDTELIELPAAETALQVFTTPGGLDHLVEQVREKVIGVVYDMRKRKDREACASDAYKVARSKSAVEKMGAALSAEYKEIPKKIDAQRRDFKEKMEVLQAEVRRPLDEWEAAEAERVSNHKLAIAGIEAIRSECGETAEAIRAAIAAISSVVIDESYEEFEIEARRVKDACLDLLNKALAVRVQYEAEQEELAELRRQRAEQEQRDREAHIAQQAAEQARADAEAKAHAEREAAAKREADARAAAEQAERDRLEAIERQRQAEARAEAERLAAEQRARNAAESARLEEIQRHQAAQAAEAEAQRRREADTKHKAGINNAALAAFVSHGLPESCAKEAVKLIAKGLIPAIRIHY